jgi:hypothetical protein
MEKMMMVEKELGNWTVTQMYNQALACLKQLDSGDRAKNEKSTWC